MPTDLRQYDAIIFDLDDTLYPYGQFMSSEDFWHFFNTFVAEQNSMPYDAVKAETDALRGGHEANLMEYWARRGSFDTNAFLALLDARDISHMGPCEQTLRFFIQTPIRKVVFTNAHRTHAERVLKQIGLYDHVEHICDYITRGQTMKPAKAPYVNLLNRLNLAPERCIMVEDQPVNLRTARELGMATVLVRPEMPNVPEYVDRYYPKLSEWLSQIHP